MKEENKYVVAVLSLFDNENKLYIVYDCNEIRACNKAILEHTKINNEIDESILDWLSNLNCETIDEALNEFVQCELCVSLPLKIN